MRVHGLCAVGVLGLVGCGATDLGRGGALDRNPRRMSSFMPRSSPVDGDGQAPPGPSPPNSASSLPEPPNQAFCSGAGWSDPAKFVLLGSTEDSIALVRADGARKVLAPLKSDTGVLYSVRSGDFLGIQEFVSKGLHVLRVDASGEVLLNLELEDVGGTFGSLRMESDGTMLLGGSGGSALRILPDGTVERQDAPPTSAAPPTAEGYFVLGPADVSGWQVVALPSSVIPLDNAFYGASSRILQRVRFRSDWVPNVISKGRIVYLGTTPEGIALIDEGVAHAGTTLLPGTMKWAQVYGSEERVVVRQSDVPVAWLDTASRAVTVLDQVIALMEGGAAHIGNRVQLLVKDRVPRRIVDVDALRDVDLTSLNLSAASSFAVHEETVSALATADGVPILWFDRQTREARALDRTAVLGAAPSGATSETLFAGAGALAVSDGLPRSWIDLATGVVSTPTLAVAAGALAKTHAVGDRAVVTVDGSPRFIVNVRSGAVSDVPRIAGLPSYEWVATTPPWLVSFSGMAPVFRVNADTAEAVPFTTAPLPLPYGFYDARFADVPANHPATGSSFSGGRLDLPVVTDDGNVLSALRDDSISGAYRIGPGDSAWQSVGQPFHDVVWASMLERKHAWVVESGQEYACYCTWPKVSWTAADPGAGMLLADAVQLVPRGGVPSVVVEGGAQLNFHPSDACVVVVPESSTTTQSPRDPFAFDLLLGIKTQLDGMRSINWIDGT